MMGFFEYEYCVINNQRPYVTNMRGCSRKGSYLYDVSTKIGIFDPLPPKSALLPIANTLWLAAHRHPLPPFGAIVI